jgi:hypothetical protein
MQSWRNSWFLVRFEMGRIGLGYIWSCLFFSYAAIMAAFVFDQISSLDKSDSITSNLVVDFYFLGILATSGFISMSRHYWGYWRSKSLTKKAMFLKSYPISAHATIQGKMLLMVLNILIQNGIFFLILWLIPSELQQMMSSMEFLEFILMWSGYSLVCGSTYVYMETSLRERHYLIGCIGIGIIILGVLGLMWSFDIHLVKVSIQFVQQYGVNSPLILFVLGAVTFIIMRIKSIQRLQSRDFYV